MYILGVSDDKSIYKFPRIAIIDSCPHNVMYCTGCGEYCITHTHTHTHTHIHTHTSNTHTYIQHTFTQPHTHTHTHTHSHTHTLTVGGHSSFILYAI